SSPLTAAGIAAVLQPTGNLKVASTRDVLLLQSEQSNPELPFELARPRNSVFRRNPEGVPWGTGPFRIAQLQSESAIFTANEEYWGGRPFLDGIEVQLKRPLREQFTDLDLGKADVVELGPNDVRAASQRGKRLWSSAPDQLVAIVFSSSVADVR